MTNYDEFQILSQIFDLLPLTDRKNVRLVSRLWYGCSTCMNITKREKFVFRTGCSTEDIAKIMMQLKHSQLNLEFQSLKISELPPYTWESCGQRVQTLEFYKCLSDDCHTISNIISHCKNLTSFVVEAFRNHVERDDVGRILLRSPCLLNDLIRKDVRLPKLDTFAIFMNDSFLSESFLRKIVLLCPCIKHFSARAGFYKDISEGATVFSGLTGCLNSVAQLDSLTLNLRTNGNWMGTLIAGADEQEPRFVRA